MGVHINKTCYKTGRVSHRDFTVDQIVNEWEFELSSVCRWNDPVFEYILQRTISSLHCHGFAQNCPRWKNKTENWSKVKSIYQVVAKQNMRQMCYQEKKFQWLSRFTQLQSNCLKLQGGVTLILIPTLIAQDFLHLLLSNGTHWLKGFTYLKYFSFGINFNLTNAAINTQIYTDDWFYVLFTQNLNDFS